MSEILHFAVTVEYNECLCSARGTRTIYLVIIKMAPACPIRGGETSFGDQSNPLNLTG